MENSQIRLENVTSILNARFKGKKVAMADALDKNQVVVQRWFSTGKGARNIGDKAAREIEDKLGLVRGWLDNVHDNNNDLEPDPQQKVILKSKAGETHIIPLVGSVLLDHQYQLTLVNTNQGKLMLLSTDSEAHAFQLVGHNPNPILDSNWGLVVEPNTALAVNEYALIWLNSGEILLRLIAFQENNSLVARHPITGEQTRLEKAQIDKALYCYIGIPPSKINKTEQ